MGITDLQFGSGPAVIVGQKLYDEDTDCFASCRAAGISQMSASPVKFHSLLPEEDIHERHNSQFDKCHCKE
jgi:hypothetical protein